MTGQKASGWGQAQPADMPRNTILPRAHAPLRTFMVAMTIMCYLAAMATGGLFMTWRALAGWKAGVTSQATAQIMPLEDDEKALDVRLRAAASLLKGQRGVSGVRILSIAENKALLRPWLGRAGLLDDLPLPRLIAVRLDPAHPADVEKLDALLRQKVKGARLDAHGRWVMELSQMASTVGWLGLAILALIALAAILLVAQAARAALEANRETIEILHLVGARDPFIARQVVRRFLHAGFVSALAGVSGAWLTLAALSLLAPSEGIGGSAHDLLFGATQATLRHYAAWLFIIITATLISLVSARTSAMRILRDIFRQG